jgi:hypothetical protein
MADTRANVICSATPLPMTTSLLGAPTLVLAFTLLLPAGFDRHLTTSPATRTPQQSTAHCNRIVPADATAVHTQDDSIGCATISLRSHTDVLLTFTSACGQHPPCGSACACRPSHQQP